MNPVLLSPRTASSTFPTAAPVPKEPAAPGRPTALTEQMLGMLCSIIRATGASDSAAAAQASLHPSTVSRWKRDLPDLAILLRAAREEYRAAHLAIIEEAAQARGAGGWRAAAWLLERIFPEDYSPRAKERALFQERFEARCASEEEGGEVALPDGGEALQNVQNSAPLLSSAPGVPAPAAPAPAPARAPIESAAESLRGKVSPRGGDAGTDALSGQPRPGRPLQNVKNTPLAGPVCPPLAEI